MSWHSANRAISAPVTGCGDSLKCPADAADTAFRRFHRLATDRDTCLRANIMRYFEKQQAKHRTSLGPRIVEWLFVTRTKPTTTKHCCDKCNSVSKDNYAQWVQAVFQAAS